MFAGVSAAHGIGAASVNLLGIEGTFSYAPARTEPEMLLLTVPVVLGAGQEFFTGAWAALRQRDADMNVLVALGTGSALRLRRFTPRR